MTTLFTKPSAWIPFTLSLLMLGFLLVLLSSHGVPTPAANADEGTAAHLFQLWLVVEFFMVGFFTITWLPRAPKDALLVLTLQVAAVFATCFPVFYFHL